jgi:hypothetical protein
MRLYIAYKYKCIKNKEQLKKDLDIISKEITKTGNDTFLLGRDVQRWGLCSTPLWKTVPIIWKNVRKSDAIFAYVISEGVSDGLNFELLCAKFLGKKVTLAVKSGLKVQTLRNVANKIVEFENIKDLISKIPSTLA